MDINKIRDERLTEDEKMELIADYLGAQSNAPDDVTIYIPGAGSAGDGTFTPSAEDYEAVKKIVLYNIYNGALPAPAGETASAGPFLVKGRAPQVTLAVAREFQEGTNIPDWGGVNNAVAYEYSNGEWESIYLTFATNWESVGGWNYTSVTMSKNEDDTITGTWVTEEPLRGN